MIVSLLSLKGGVGKTTSAMHLAAVIASSRKRAVVLDADEERSATSWADLAGDALPFGVVAADRDRLAKQARDLETSAATVVIDTPPNSREIIARAAMVSDWCIVPVLSSGLDVDRLRGTLELLADLEASRPELKTVVMFTRFRARERLSREALDALENIPQLKTRIRDLVAYRAAFGGTPVALEEYRKAWKELRP